MGEVPLYSSVKVAPSADLARALERLYLHPRANFIPQEVFIKSPSSREGDTSEA